MTDYVAWLEALAEKGGKGVVNNIDARAIGRAASHMRAMEEALEQIVSWSKAYPLDVFPDPDFKRAAQVLKNAGMTLDAISASNMRHVVNGVGAIAKGALPNDNTKS